METSSGIPLEETEWYKNGGHAEWVERNRRWGYAYRFVKAYEGNDPRMLELKLAVAPRRKRGDPDAPKARLLTPMELEEVYEFSRSFPELPPADPDAEKKVRGQGKISWTAEAKRVREQGLVPISDAHRAELRRKLEQLSPGVHCEFVYLTEKSHLTRKGDFVSYDDENIILMGENGSFWKIPIEKVFHGSYDVKQQGGKLE